MAALVAVLALLLMPRGDVLRDRVDCIEINTTPAFTQAIFWDMRGGSYEIRAWRMCQGDAMRPRRDLKSGRFAMLWNDKGQMRRVISPAVVYTWTEHDPEMARRSEFPVENRLGLRGEKHNEAESMRDVFSVLPD